MAALSSLATVFGGPCIIPPVGGGLPIVGYLVLLGKQPDGSSAILSGLNADSSRTPIQGKAA